LRSRTKVMAKHSRKILMLVALCWIAPASAQRPAEAGHDHRACPESSHAVVGSAAFPGEMSLFDFGAGAPGLLP